jgi:hypothetical protein
VTKETSRDLIKWNVGGGPPTGWIELSTPIPTTGTALGVPGLYEGAEYCVTGLYRPTYNSKMRNANVPFEQINEEQLIKRIYNFVSPLDFYYPLDNDLILFLGESLEFSVGVPQPASDFLDVMWHVDDVSKGAGNEFTLDSSKNLDTGIHTVEAIIQDKTLRVRNDPWDVLTESNSWQVTIESRDQILIINASVGGTTDPTPGTYSYDTGTDVAIAATPDMDYDFSYWSGDVPQGNENDNPITITMASDKSITANFVLKQYTLTIATDTGGTTDPTPGSYTYDSGTQITITATPDSGYEFSNWSGDVSGTTNPIAITMDSDKSVTANFSATEAKKKGGCFIATAAYGSLLHPYVETLRDFRDKYLMPSKVGRMLVSIYYKYSPFSANLIAKYKVLGIIVRLNLLPLVAFSYLMLHFGPIITVVLIVFIFILPIFLISFFQRKLRRIMSTCDF